MKENKNNESAKYWLGTLNELKNRGVKDILIICSDGLKGINEAIKAVIQMLCNKDVLFI